MKVLVISDIHGNYEALKAVLERAGRYDDVLVLGDLVDYGPDPELVVDFVRSLGAKAIRGNHDEAAAYGVDCRCGPELHELSVYTRSRITASKLSREDLEYLKLLPEKMELTFSSKKVPIVHGNLQSPLYGYTYPWLKDEELCGLFSPKRQVRLSSRGEYEETGQDYIFIGHTHLPFLRSSPFFKIANPGSAGQPRDGDPRASAMLFDPDEEKVEFLRVQHSIDRVVDKLKLIIDDSRFLNQVTSLLRTGRVTSDR